MPEPTEAGEDWSEDNLVRLTDTTTRLANGYQLFESRVTVTGELLQMVLFAPEGHIVDVWPHEKEATDARAD